MSGRMRDGESWHEKAACKGKGPHRCDGLCDSGSGDDGHIFRAKASAARRLAAPLILLLASIACGQDRAHPLKPPDRSSPRATVRTFLESADAVAAFVAREYMSAPTRQGFHHLRSLVQVAVDCLDLSEAAPATRQKVGSTAAMALYETLSRIDLPPLDEIPGAAEAKELGETARWVIPNTQIAIVRMQGGPHVGEFLFSAATVAHSEEYYRRVQGLPYTRPVPLHNLYDLAVLGGGWFVPFSWVQAMPAWLRTPVLGQSAWKWIAMLLVLGLFGILLRLAIWLSRRGIGNRPFLEALAYLILPVFLLAWVPVMAYLILFQINVFGGVATAVGMATTAMMYFAAAWIAWRLAPVIAEAVIASPRISPESVDAHLIRTCARLLAIVTAAGLLAVGANALGLPLYGIVAGLGVGGLALALAAQPTIENLIGGFSLFADKPVRAGDLCKYGESMGTVETIGIRSTRIRGFDRTITTIPNAALSKMAIVNFAQRDRILIRTVLGVRYETTSDQLRQILAAFREMLLKHPRIASDPLRVRFIGFGASSLDIEIFAYALTQDRAEFFAIQEDVFLRVMDIIEQKGAAVAFPSQTLYLARDSGPAEVDAIQAKPTRPAPGT
jgi:MscS family membrane protein